MSDGQPQEPKKKKRSGSATRQRDCVVKIRTKPEERAEMEANAAAAGLCLSSYVRSVTTLRQRTRAVRRRPSPDMLRVAQVLAHTGRIGGNMYQLVRGMNLGDVPTVEEMHAAAKEARALIADAREAFGL
jgi:hypothetical protein